MDNWSDIEKFEGVTREVVSKEISLRSSEEERENVSEEIAFPTQKEGKESINEENPVPTPDEKGSHPTKSGRCINLAIRLKYI